MKTFALTCIMSLGLLTSALAKPNLNVPSTPNLWGHTSSAPTYQQAFHRKEGWTGADGTYSYASGSSIIWGFSDTFFGSVIDGARAKPYTFVHNSLVYQTGSTFTFPAPSQAFSVPDNDQDWFWLFDGTDDGQILLGSFTGTGANDFGFTQTGLWWARFSLGQTPPIITIRELHQLPFFYRDDHELLTFGPALFDDEGTTYLYGIRDEKGQRFCILARAPQSQVGQAQTWQFFDGKEWTSSLRSCASLFPGAAMEASVYKTRSQQYLYVASAEGGLSAKVVVRSAPHPTGPWSEPHTIFIAPEHQGDVFVYNAKAHPDIQDAHRVLISYNVNTSNLNKVENDASLYRPRFFWWTPPHESYLPEQKPLRRSTDSNNRSLF